MLGLAVETGSQVTRSTTASSSGVAMSPTTRNYHRIIRPSMTVIDAGTRFEMVCIALCTVGRARGFGHTFAPLASERSNRNRLRARPGATLFARDRCDQPPSGRFHSGRRTSPASPGLKHLAYVRWVTAINPSRPSRFLAPTTQLARCRARGSIAVACALFLGGGLAGCQVWTGMTDEAAISGAPRALENLGTSRGSVWADPTRQEVWFGI
jgi:hypothetical protein